MLKEILVGVISSIIAAVVISVSTFLWMRYSNFLNKLEKIPVLEGRIAMIEAKMSHNRDQINSLFGEGNWFCYPDRQDGLGVQRTRDQFEVKAPLRYVQTSEGRFDLGQRAGGGRGSNVELTYLKENEAELLSRQPAGTPRNYQHAAHV